MRAAARGSEDAAVPVPGRGESEVAGSEAGGSTVPRGILEAPVQVTEGMVDEAVNNVVKARGIKEDAAEALKATLGRDTGGGPMHAYYTSKAAVTRARMVGVAREDLVIDYVLDELNGDVQNLTDYAPEFRLRFHSTISHDHAMGAATRLIDNRLIFSRLPSGVRFSDIGGNPLTYVKQGVEGWHVCGPVVDAKDPMRHRLRRMEAVRIARTYAGTAVGDAAERYLRMDAEMCCNCVAQECSVQTPIGVAVHVYDIPMRDWPAIMEKKALSVVEGCLLFSPRFFEETSGELGVSRARFEIDVAKDKFKMGFTKSPSWWYEHKFSEYLLYGTDQLMTRGSYTYSYKIIERRGDTVFYRILRLPSNLTGEKRVNSYRTPGVEVVQVHGFKMTGKRHVKSSVLERQTYFFPKNLWGEMVAQAAEDFERGVMDFNKMYNHYRTISVRHTINAVLVMGGEQVSADELVPLVVHSCLAAAAQSLLGQRTTRAITDSVMRYRGSKADTTLTKVLAALRAMVTAAALAPLYPLMVLAERLKDFHYASVEQWVLDWEPVCSVVKIESGTLLAAGSMTVQAISAEVVYKSSAIDSAPFDHYAAVVNNKALASVVKGIFPHLDVGPGVPTPVEGGNGPDSGGFPSAPPSYVTDPPVAPREPQVGPDEAAIRVEAIREHILEAQMQNRTLAFSCGEAYRSLSVRGEPNRQALRKQAELFRNPDFWRVEKGVIVESVLGLDPEGFVHSAVYHPRPDPDTGEVVRAVHRADWSGSDPRAGMQEVVNKNFVLADSEFSGWVLTTDELVVYNGPEIIGAMQKAVGLIHDYTVRLYWGPPGCGKTYSIIHTVEATGTDAIMCPVRESIEDTRGQVVARFPEFPGPRRYVRTVDSYLVNFSSDRRTGALKVDRLLADECFMAHAGKWYAAAALLGVSKLYAYGDDYQIPHIPRVQAPKLHVKLRTQEREHEWCTRRCPGTAVAAWGSVYDWKVRTLSTKRGTMVEVQDTKGMEIPDGCVMMCMYQADKKDIKKLYATDLKKIKIVTAHESEGKTYKHVWLHRFDARKRNDKFSLFDQQPHVLVAMSRHTDGFLYRCPASLGDLVSQWVTRAADPRRVAAAMDVVSKGTSVEKL